MDRLTIMKTFTAVIDAGKFSGAARKLGISRALTSQHVSVLEKELGARLINRTTRSVVLTEAGRQYYDFSKRILSEISAQDAALSSTTSRPEGSLAVISPKWIGSLDLGDAIAHFAATYPKIKVRLDLGGMTDRPHHFVDQGYDVAVHTKPMKDSGLIIRKVATLEFILCASPDYLKKRKKPVTPNDLLSHSCLVHVDDPVWRFTVDDEVKTLRVSNVAFSSNTYLVLQKAAMQGMGIVALPYRSVRKETQAGTLKILLPEFPIPQRPLYIAVSSGRQHLPKVRCFIDFIADWFKVSRPLV